MRIFLTILITLSSFGAYGDPFSYLKKEVIDTFDYKKKQEMVIHYNPKLFSRIWKKAKDFPKEHPFYTNEAGYDDITLGVFDISGKGDKYYVRYSTGPSMDVYYCFNKEKTVLDAIKEKKRYIRCDDVIYGLSIAIPGNGSIYAYGHNNTMYDYRNKYALKDGKISIVGQPFQYIGKKSISKKEQFAYTDETLKSIAFKITKGYEVTIIGIKPKNRNKAGTGELFLVASKFGLVGWVPSDGWQTESQFEGFFFLGD